MPTSKAKNRSAKSKAKAKPKHVDKPAGEGAAAGAQKGKRGRKKVSTHLISMLVLMHSEKQHNAVAATSCVGPSCVYTTV